MEPYRNAALSPHDRARDLLSRMTLREKVGQLNQRLYGFACYVRSGESIRLTKEFEDEAARFGGMGALYGLYRADPWSKRDDKTGLSPALAKKAYNLAQRCVLEHSRLGIPVLMSSECPHGHQALGGYLLPVNLCVGAAWNPALLREACGVCARQLSELGVDLSLMSVLDVLRDPRWGRSEECYSEDPFLSARLAEAAVTGAQENGVTAVAKHFCAQGEGKGGINTSAAAIGPRELREIHLPPAQACCRAGVGGMMAAYNEIDGIPCHANPNLLRGILRGEFGFNGVVMADGTAIDRLDALTGSSAKSGALALRAGVDLSLWDSGFPCLEEAVERGFVEESVLEEAVLRVLRLKFERGLFEHPFLDETVLPHRFSHEEYPQSLELARQGAVLLKNDGALLPLSARRFSRVAVIGPNADNLYAQLGDYSPTVPAKQAVTVRQGLERLWNGEVRYARGCGLFDGTDEELEEAAALAAECDLTVLVLGGSSSRFSGTKFDTNGAAVAGGPLQMDCGEGVDCAGLRLGGKQEALFARILAAGKPVVTVLIGGRPYAVPEIAAQSTALLVSFYPGPMGGRAVAEILLGLAEPGGRLPVSFPRSAGQLPVYYNPRGSYHAMEYFDLPDTPLFCFGDGLSYTRFAFSGFRLSAEQTAAAALERRPVTLSFTVSNLGARGGWTVPSLYIHGLSGSVVRRKKELRAFEKRFLKAGESAEMTLALDYAAFAVWDAALRFTVEPGSVRLFLEDGGTRRWEGVVTVR